MNVLLKKYNGTSSIPTFYCVWLILIGYMFRPYVRVIFKPLHKMSDTKKFLRNDGRTPMFSLRFYAYTLIITTYYLIDTSVTCIFSYVIYVA